MSFYMRILNRTEKNRRFLFLAAVFAVCTAAMLTVLMMPQKQVVAGQ
jgi:type IV secretory pathway component VirB8